MDEKHRTRRGVEGKLRRDTRIVLVAASGVMGLHTVGECVRRIDCNRPLHVAGKLIEIVDRPIRSGFSELDRAHERQVSAGRGPHDSDAVGIELLSRRPGCGRSARPAADPATPSCCLANPPCGTRRAVFDRHDRHALFIQVTPDRSDFEAVRVVAQ